MYNLASYGDCAVAHRAGIIITCLSDVEYNVDITTIDTLNNGKPCGYEEYINDSINVTEDLYSLPFPNNVL